MKEFGSVVNKELMLAEINMVVLSNSNCKIKFHDAYYVASVSNVISV